MQWCGTNLKVGDTSPAQSTRNFLSRPSTFWHTSTSSRYGERFRDGQYSLVSFLIAVLLLTVPPPCRAICKSGEDAPPPPVRCGVGATLYRLVTEARVSVTIRKIIRHCCGETRDTVTLTAIIYTTLSNPVIIQNKDTN